jgi:site-specific recombinase XerD
MVSKQYKLSEAAKILGEKLETLRTKAKRGEIPTETTYEGNRPCKVISAETLANLLQNIDTSSYEDLKAQWQREMLAGTHSGTSTPVSENYMRDLQWGLKKYWLANPGRESVEGLNADGLRNTFAQFSFDEAARRDFYSSKMHVYKAISSFTQFLIRKGHKSPSVLEEIKAIRPKARVKPQRHSLDLAEVWDAISFNRRWNDGRTAVDVETTDMLLFLYGFAGLRRMEAANITISGLDFKKNEILVHGKWGKDRLVPMPQDLADKLREWLEKWRPKSDLPYVLVSVNGNQLTDRSIGCRFSRLSKTLAMHKAIALIKARATMPSVDLETLQYTPESDIEIFFPGRNAKELRKEAEKLAKTLKILVRPHDLRRAYAKMLADQGMPLPRVQYVLGHNDIETTMKYINIKQKEATDWVRENFVITLPKTAKPQPPVAEVALPEETSPNPPTKPERKRKYRY